MKVDMNVLSPEDAEIFTKFFTKFFKSIWSEWVKENPIASNMPDEKFKEYNRRFFSWAEETWKVKITKSSQVNTSNFYEEIEIGEKELSMIRLKFM